MVDSLVKTSQSDTPNKTHSQSSVSIQNESDVPPISNSPKNEDSIIMLNEATSNHSWPKDPEESKDSSKVVDNVQATDETNTKAEDEPVNYKIPVNNDDSDVTYRRLMRPRKITGRILKLINIPDNWVRRNVVRFITTYTSSTPEIAESIEDVVFIRKSRSNHSHVTFTTSAIALLAKDLLKQIFIKIRGKVIIVDLVKYVPIPERRKNQVCSPPGGAGAQADTELWQPSTYDYKVLRLRNIPLSWEKQKIEDYIHKHTSCDPTIRANIRFVSVEKVKGKFNSVAQVKFENQESCRTARTLLRAVNSENIWVNFDNKRGNVGPWLSNDNLDSHQPQHIPSNLPNTSYNNSEVEDLSQNYRIFENELELRPQGPKGNFGLSLKFLADHSIQLPLTTKIFVTNLDLAYEDEAKIRTLFGYAGMILSVVIVGRTLDTIKLKVEYDHPVEAVQAVVMFDHQEVYDKKLVVRMDKTSYKRKFLPEGLKAFGPGLGPRGVPLRGVRSALEQQHMMNVIMGGKARTEENCYVDSQPGGTAIDLSFNAHPAGSMNPGYQVLNPMGTINNLIYPEAKQIEQWITQFNTAKSPYYWPIPHVLGVINPASSSPCWNMRDQTAETMNLMGGFNAQNGANMQTGLSNHGNTQAGLNTQGGPMQGGINTQSGPMQGEINTTGGPTQAGINTQGVHNVQSGINTQGGTMQGAHNMQSRINTQGGPMQGAHNMQTQILLPVPAMARALFGYNMGVCGSNMPSPLNLHAESSHTSTGSGPKQNHGGTTKNTKNSDDSNRNRKPDREVSSTVLFNYLPPSVTMSALRKKMEEVGDIKVAEATGPGRAIVVFYSKRDAEACITLLDQSRVDGQTIDVRFL